MAPSASIQPSPTPMNGAKNGRVQTPDQCHTSLRDLVSILSQACEMVGTKELAALVEENKTLKVQLEEGRLARIRIYGDLQKEMEGHEEKIEALKKLQAKVADRENQLQAELKDNSTKVEKAEAARKRECERALKAEGTCTQQFDKIKNLEARKNTLELREKNAVRDAEEAKKTIEGLRQELQSMKRYESEVSTINSFGLPLTDVQQNRNEYAMSLGRMFSTASTLLKEVVFQNEIDFTSISSTDWTRLKRDLALSSHEIPLPGSNSLVAKQMRFAAALRFLGQTLCKYVFRPVYLSSSEDWLSDELRSLSDDESPRERHIRSMLLNLSPHEQTRVSSANIESAHAIILGTLGCIVPEGSKSKLDRGLLKIFNDALEVWAKLQKVREHVMSDFEYGSADEWRPLPLPGASGHKNEHKEATGQTPPVGQGGPGSLVSDYDPTELWPAFIAEDVLLLPGRYLAENVFEEAREEEEMARRHARKTGRSVKGNGSISKRRDSKAFLSSQSS